MPWSQRFDRPILLPDGRLLETLGDARAWLLTIPTADYSEAMGAAAEALLMAAERRGPMMHANVAVAQAVHGPRPPPEPRPPKQPPYPRVKLLRDR